MKKCDCIRFLALKASMKDESIYLFNEDEFIPVEAVFPLEEFEPNTGKILTVCPYFNCMIGERIIPRAFKRLNNKTLSKDDHTVIDKAVEECKNNVPSDKFLVLSERNRDILEMFCAKKNLKKTYRLVKNFLSFLSSRQEAKTDDPCKDVLPEEKKDCYDQRWIAQFEEYLKSVGFRLPKEG